MTTTSKNAESVARLERMPIFALPAEPAEAVRLLRYARRFKEAGVSADVLAPPQLASLFKTCPFARVRADGPAPGDRVRPMGMMEAEFGSPSDGSEDTPYLFPGQPARSDSTGVISGRARVGVIWQDEQRAALAKYRSSGSSCFTRLLDGLEVDAVVLGPRGEPDDVPVAQWSDLADLAALAALIRGLDLVIATDSVPAHLAGAMAVPTWLVVPADAGLLWQTRRDDTPWYTGMRIFRQRRAGAWEDVFARLRAELTTFLAVRQGVLPPGRSVSCLCVTRGRPALLKRAIYCFDRQTHPLKQLVVVADADDAPTLDFLQTLASRKDIKVVVPDTRLTLGELRNLAIEAASGEYVAQWDDDDFYHPGRLAAQLAHAERSGRLGCVLSRWILRVGRRALVSGIRAWEGSILCRRREVPAYPTLSRAEDTAVITSLFQRQALACLDQPGLYVYEYHGANTWDEQHWQALIDDSGSAAKKPSFPVLDELEWYEGRSATARHAEQPDTEPSDADAALATA